ncbi:beta-ketoacyl-ACP synthase III [Desulfotalea psychrophila]|uniref:Related to 3-oxoacyl-[acyl-carrier-protein] synthase III n=1 Tax=Desulfotalea psychrophila (strain LSv54 / DSM 12343) TaxID=177439 RepID=Q6AM79_DESPS|nr:beta-ketoacyl-ACP synthase III [Desulfotalea psychrophila]CAG36546.1 related to 3-oxoacyl-[acyl-carrier-protein] synthase III [Desulfotalea psychrophila LSv54]
MSVYITDIASFLPNAPVDNEQMEEILGMVNQLPSRTRRIILRNNRIKTRYYAIDPVTGETTHSNTQLTAEAVRRLRPAANFQLDEIECLCCGTSSPDQLMPGHAPMVHGELGNAACEVMTAAGICTSGMTAMRYAWLNVLAGQSSNAVATGSELASTFMRSRLCNSVVSEEKIEQMEKQPVLSFEADFLRWMLSDGAGAAYLTNAPRAEGLSLKIEWIDLLSFAHELPTCMYAGASKGKSGALVGWREHAPVDALSQGAMLIKQDVKLLNEEIITTAVERTLPRLIEKYDLQAEEIDWFLPHYSSDYFRLAFYERMEKIGFAIPLDRWFTNLTSKGNTGSASIYIILAELFHSGRIKRGEKILCFIPESGRFSMCYMLLTAC